MISEQMSGDLGGLQKPDTGKHGEYSPFSLFESIDSSGNRKYAREHALKVVTESGLTSGSLQHRLCAYVLMRGCVNSFIELHRLSHREPVCIDKLAEKMFTIPDDDLPWLADTLCEAEEYRRQSRFKEVYDKHIEIASYFEGCHDKDTAIHFHNLGLKCTKQSSDKELEGVAHEQLGLACERLGNLPEAIKCHETFLRLAEATRNTKRKVDANSNLIRVYVAYANQLEAEGRYEEAKEYYEKTVHTAASNGDQNAEADAYNKIGHITVLLGDLQRALDYHKRFLLVSKQMNCASKEGRAARECAVIQEKLQQHNEAASSLKRALEIAEDQEDLDAMAESCQQLGQLYNNMGEYAKAVHYFKENFRVAQIIGRPLQVEQARIQLGLAEGNLQWSRTGGKGYLTIVATDINTMLHWKQTGELHG